MIASRPPLRLLGQRLTPNDVAKIRVFLRIGQQKLGCEWTLVSDGEADVLIMSGDEADTVLGLLENPRATLCVVDSPVDPQGSSATFLVRPLQYEPFIDALSQVEDMVLSMGTSPVRAIPPAALAPVIAVPAPATVHAEPVAASSLAAAVAAALSQSAVYRLRRWPAADVLRGDRYNVRLASFLSTRHVSLAELARLSNLGAPECHAFVAKLLAADLLDVKQGATSLPVVSSSAPERSSRASSGGSSRSRQPDPGLFDKIRQSLGMGGSR